MLATLSGLIPQNLAFPTGGMDLAFYVVALFMLVTAVCTVAVKNILQSAVFLIFSFVGTAILYLLLHAEFTALAQVMVYVGGVVIFVVFTILLTSRLGEDAFAVKIPRVFAAFALSIIFTLTIWSLPLGSRIFSVIRDFFCRLSCPRRLRLAEGFCTQTFGLRPRRIRNSL